MIPWFGALSLVATLASAASAATSSVNRKRKACAEATRRRHTHTATPNPKGMTSESVASRGDPVVPPDARERTRRIQSCRGARVLNAA